MEKLTKRKILITGGAGFIGANFVYKFLALGYSVIIFEKEGIDLWRLEKLKKKIEIHFTDLTKYDAVEKLVKKIKPQIVLHFATYGAYQRTQQDTDLTINTNLKGTINLVNACQKVGVECFINTGSNSEYGIKTKTMKETDLPEPDNLYAITKLATTAYCQMMARKFDFPVAIVRPFAVYGPFEEKERLIPSIMVSLIKNKDIKLSSPNSVRDFIFIDDLIDGYLSIIKNIKKVKGEVFNLGSGRQFSIRQVVTMAKKITRSNSVPHYGQIKKAQTESTIWLADISKAKKMLGWKPKYNLEKGLKKDIAWFKENLSDYE